MPNLKLKYFIYSFAHFLSGQRKIKLPDTYLGALIIEKEPAYVERVDIVRALERCLPSGRKYERKIIKQYWQATLKKRDYVFDKLITAINRIAPRGCYFGEYHLLWGFWKKR